MFLNCVRKYIWSKVWSVPRLSLARKDIVTPRSQYSALGREKDLGFSILSLNTHSCRVNFVRMLRIPGPTRGDVFGVLFCTMQSRISVFNIRYLILGILMRKLHLLASILKFGAPKLGAESGT